ncbi:hypothetical protein [Corynebacterium aquatimens]|uniref:hypothetical protein n=1 Tax=Corynebacterium aquatimens TaxID=1190508 RepID=UPI00361F9F4F
MAKRYGSRTAIAGIAALAIAAPSVYAVAAEGNDNTGTGNPESAQVSSAQSGASETPKSGASETPKSGASETPKSGASETPKSGASETPKSGESAASQTSGQPQPSGSTTTSTSAAPTDEVTLSTAKQLAAAGIKTKNARVLGVTVDASKFVDAPKGSKVTWAKKPTEQDPKGIVKIELKDGTVYYAEVTANFGTANGQSSLAVNAPKTVGYILIGISLLGLIASQIPFPGLKEFNTQLQQQIGLFNPALASQADKVVPVIGGLTGLLGLITGIIFAVKGQDQKLDEAKNSSVQVKDKDGNVTSSLPKKK